jgi:hypothetical protein
MSKQQGTLLLLTEGSGKFVRKKIRTFRIHDEWGAAKDYGPSFKGEVFIEEGADGIDLQVFKQALEPAPQKNEKTSAVMIGMYSVGLIILGMAVHSMMLVRLLH